MPRRLDTLLEVAQEGQGNRLVYHAGLGLTKTKGRARAVKSQVIPEHGEQVVY